MAVGEMPDHNRDLGATATTTSSASATTTNTNTPSTTNTPQNPTPTKPTAKELAARYGGAYLATSIALSILSFAAFYLLIAVGVDVRGGIIALGDWLATTPLGRPEALNHVSDAGGTFALAYVAHKATSPLRFPPTIVATEFVARLLGKDKQTKK